MKIRMMCNNSSLTPAGARGNRLTEDGCIVLVPCLDDRVEEFGPLVALPDSTVSEFTVG
jgi:hypothetical protein